MQSFPHFSPISIDISDKIFKNVGDIYLFLFSGIAENEKEHLMVSSS